MVVPLNRLRGGSTRYWLSNVSMPVNLHHGLERLALGMNQVLGVEAKAATQDRRPPSIQAAGPFDQSAEETPEGVVRGGQDSGNILPNAHSRTDSITDLHISQGEVAALVGEAAPQSRHRERLARRADDDDVRLAALRGPSRKVRGGDVAEIRRLGEPLR